MFLLQHGYIRIQSLLKNQWISSLVTFSHTLSLSLSLLTDQHFARFCLMRLPRSGRAMKTMACSTADFDLFLAG